jgi:hypothetical protein
MARTLPDAVWDFLGKFVASFTHAPNRSLAG